MKLPDQAAVDLFVSERWAHLAAFAHVCFRLYGRGLVIADLRPDKPQAFYYQPQAKANLQGDEPRQLVATYAPDTEFVLLVMEPERGIYVHAEAAERSTPQTSYGRERLQAASVGRRLTDKQLGAYLKRALEATLRTH